MKSRSSGCPASGAGPTRCPSPRRLIVPMLLTLTLVVPTWVTAQDEAQPVPSVPAPLAASTLVLDVTSVDDTLVAVGQRGHVLVSRDGGDTWTQADVPTSALLTAVHFADRNNGWVAGHDGAILRTADGAQTWELIHWAPEDEAPFFEIWFSDANNGRALGAYGSSFVTTDGGLTWDFEAIDPEWDYHLHNFAIADSGRQYIAAEAGIAYRSDDDGATWSELPSPYEGSFFGVLPLDGDVVLLFGLRGHLYRSEDAGETWTEVDTGTVAMLTDGIHLTDGRVVITGLGGTLLVSDDAGVSFARVPQPDRSGIQAIAQIPSGDLVVAGEFGLRIIALGEIDGAEVAP